MDLQSQNLNSHPKGLPVLFFTETWERFSFYGMRALLVLFLTKVFHFSDPDANRIYGIYTGLVYLTPLVGGYLADRYLGFKKSIFLGATLMMFGHGSLAFETKPFFLLGLALLIIGIGFFKPNISTVMGRIYEEDNKTHMKDSGFTIFYMGINLGGFLGPLFCGYFSKSFGWGYGFGVAAFGVLFGILIFFFGQKRFSDRVFEPGKKLHTDEGNGQSPWTREEKQRVVIILIFTAFAIVFWAVFEQIGSSMNLFVDRHVDRNWFGYDIPTPFFQSLNPLLILTLTPLIASFWTALSKRNRKPDTSLRFVCGFFILGSGFLILTLGTLDFRLERKISAIWLVLTVACITVGELFTSPGGLALVTKLAPKRLGGFMMGVWFLSSFFGNILAGELAGLMKTDGFPTFFGMFAGLAFAGGGALYFVQKKFRTWIRDSDF
ncbi:peptide MFS transporter [Leptospira santarosai]|uniref:peptide MFS transporter n=1 Tax=Leptospira santarosai TaxID=28183 RepID=UPI0002BEC524|nr:peptide MFS transporter [Leptospira santarosai]EMO23967.1 transporter, major facilitator family protein [Leptospira santarosai str. HAI134]EMP82855.1 transporter, major facilitator family protein [Leptospira santarosai str. CBC1531]